jgi:hypothetical protein
VEERRRDASLSFDVGNNASREEAEIQILNLEEENQHA